MLTSKWLAYGLDHSQTAASRDAAVCGHFDAKQLFTLSNLLLVFIGIRKAHFIMNKQYSLHHKFIN